MGADEGELLVVEHVLHGIGGEHGEKGVGGDGPRPEAADHAGKAATGRLDEGVGALAGLLEHLGEEHATVDAADGTLGVDEATVAARLLDAQVADVDEAREDALVGKALDDVGELAR